MPSIFVMGASGNVGSAVRATLAEAGVPVRLAHRGPAPLDRLPAGSDALRSTSSIRDSFEAFAAREESSLVAVKAAPGLRRGTRLRALP